MFTSAGIVRLDIPWFWKALYQILCIVVGKVTEVILVLDVSRRKALDQIFTTHSGITILVALLFA